MRLEREVAGVEEAHLRVRVVGLEGLGARRQEEGIVAAPDREEGRAVAAEVVVELRIQRQVARVVEEQVELDLDVVGPLHQRPVELPGLGRHLQRIGRAVHVLPARGLVRELGRAHGLAVGRVRLAPIGAQHAPALAQALLVGIAVLRHDRAHPLGPRQREPEAHGRAVVEHVERVAMQPERVGEAFDHLGEVVEAVREGRPRGRLGEAEARQVGRDDVEAVRQQRDQVAEHVRRAREAVQQQQGGSRAIAGLAIEDLVRADGDGVETNHGKTPASRWRRPGTPGLE